MDKIETLKRDVYIELFRRLWSIRWEICNFKEMLLSKTIKIIINKYHFFFLKWKINRSGSLFSNLIIKLKESLRGMWAHRRSFSTNNFFVDVNMGWKNWGNDTGFHGLFIYLYYIKILKVFVWWFCLVFVY